MRFGQKIILIVYSLFFILLSIFFVPYNVRYTTGPGLNAVGLRRMDEEFERWKAERRKAEAEGLEPEGKPEPIPERIVRIHYHSIWYEHVDQINSKIWLMEIVTLSIVMGVAFVLIGQNKRNG
jgi:hypothetical protein